MSTENSPNEKTVIALAGHTNAGKTTMLRTLTKANFGDIDDRANTTKEAASFEYSAKTPKEEMPIKYEAFQATFVDCPGFQNAGPFLFYLQLTEMMKDNDQEKINAAFSSDFTFDKRALMAIENADVALYVATLEVVPDDSYIAEIRLIQTKQPRIVGLLNKYESASKSQPMNVANRIKQWCDRLEANGIKEVIVFDAHWDSPSKVTQIYKSIAALLPTGKQKALARGLAAFKEHQQQVRKLACAALVQCVIDCREIELTAKSEVDGYDERKTEQKLREKINKQIEMHLDTFIKTVVDLYDITSQNPNLPPEMRTYYINRKKSFMERAVTVAATTSIGTAAGAALGGLLGAVFGPVGIAAGATLGAKVAAVLGAAGGASGAVVGSLANTNTAVTARPANDLLQGIAETGLAIILGLSHHGFGFSASLSESQVQALMQRLGEASKWDFVTRWSWSSAGREQIASWCEKTLDKLENDPRLSVAP